MRVVVTGAAGFIGRRLVSRQAEEGCDVHVVDAVPVSPLPPGVHSLQADLCDPGTAELVRGLRPDWLVHLAGMSQVGACERDPRAAFEHNVTATANVVRGLGGAGLVLASSALVYDPAASRAGEDDPPLPAGVYGTTKVLAEELARLYARRTGGPAVILRLANVYGPGDRSARVLPAILRQLREGAPVLRLGDLEARRDFVYVDDVVEVIRSAMEGARGCRVVNVGTGALHSVRELLEHAVAASGRSPRIDARRGDAAPDPPLLDVSRLRETFPHVPLTSLHDGIARTLAEEGLLDASTR